MTNTPHPAVPAVAFVTHTRPFRTALIHQALAGSGLTIVDRPADATTVDLVRRVEPRLVVLALRPGRDSDLLLIRRVQAAAAAPILVILPGPGAQGVASALAAGADVCLRDTDSPQVVSAQLAALTRRIRGRGGNSEPELPAGVVVAQDLRLDTDRFEVRRGEELVTLTPTEFRILDVLVRNAGRVVSPAQILREVRGGIFSEAEAQSLVKVYVQRIRKKLGDQSERPRYIVNVRGFGYMFERRDPGQAGRAAA
ncbi:MAG: response regulator transcription factor [Dehalococcoidia bacterium]